MESTTLNVRIDVNDKKNFEKFCNSVGMNVSTAVNVFIKTVIREQKMPFDIKSSSYDDMVYKRIREAEEEMKNTSKRYSLDEVMEGLTKIIENK